MRIVDQNSPIWREPGIAGTHIAIFFDCDQDGWTPLKFWADRVSLRRKNPVKKVSAESLPQGSSDWLQWRAAGVGGSEVAIVCGESRYGSKTGLWKEKTAARRGEKVSGGHENEHMRRGKEIEPIAREEYEQLMGWKCQPLCVIDDVHDYMRCSLDGLRDDGELVLEIKAPGAKNHAKTIDVRDSGDPERFAIEIPHYYCQVQYQLRITGAKMAHFVSYNRESQFAGGNRLVLVEVPANEPFQAEIERRVREFWEEYVVKEIPPPGR